MPPRRFGGMLAGSMVLFLLYVVVALRQHNFALPDFNYSDAMPGHVFGMPPMVFQSLLWKVILLLPGTILFAVALTRAGLRVPLPSIRASRTIVPLVLVAAAILLIASVEFVFHETEVTDDENAYDFQASTLLAGRIVNPPPPGAAKGTESFVCSDTDFDNAMLINDGRHWIGKYTLGHPAIIALGMALGNRYIVTIGLSILMLLLVYFIALELYPDKSIALLAFCLGGASPFFYAVSSSRLSHTTSAFFLTLFMYLFLRMRREQRDFFRAFLALSGGLSLGYAFNVRPLTALGFSLPFVLVTLTDLRHGPKRKILFGMILTAGFAMMFALTLWYNTIVTEKALLFPFVYFCPWERIGFGSLHTPFSAMHNLALTIVRMNGALFGFPVSLIFIFVFLFARKENADRFLFGIIGSFVCAYSLYYSPGVQDLGPIYYYELLVPLLLLSARGIQYAHRLVSTHFDQSEMLITHFVVASFLVAFVAYVPERISHLERLTDQIRKPYEVVRSANIQHALVFFPPAVAIGEVAGYRSPSPLFTDNVIFCRYVPDRTVNREVAAYFPHRSLYIISQDTTRTHVKLLPLSRSDL